MDPENPVVKLCMEGMRAEGAGELEKARALFAQAWQTAQDDFEACVAAHFVARHQPTPEEALYWNQVALDRAEAAGNERVAGFYPSLYLNLGYAYEMLGEDEAARHCYNLAAAQASRLPAGRYGDLVRDGISRGIKRVGLDKE